MWALDVKAAALSVKVILRGWSVISYVWNRVALPRDVYCRESDNLNSTVKRRFQGQKTKISSTILSVNRLRFFWEKFLKFAFAFKISILSLLRNNRFQIEAGEGAAEAIQQLEEERKQLESRLADTQSQATQQTADFTAQLTELQEELAKEKEAAESILQLMQVQSETETQLQRQIEQSKLGHAELQDKLVAKVGLSYPRCLNTSFTRQCSVYVASPFTIWLQWTYSAMCFEDIFP